MCTVWHHRLVYVAHIGETINSAIVVKQYWPDQKVAEHENIMRIEQAANSLGVKVIRVDQFGEPISPDEKINWRDVLFVLDLHFVTPRISSVPSVAALWNPWDYLANFGLEHSLANQLSHDVYVSPNPIRAKSWLKVVRPDYLDPVLALNHTLPKSSFLSASADGAKGIFYAGIGWDRRPGLGQRHKKLLSEISKTGLLEIYGPKKIAGDVEPWREFPAYRGELPFDGVSSLRAINACGFGLCFSSASHLEAGIFSNRLFETIAAGAIPIIESDLDYPFDLDGAVFIDELLDEEEKARAIDAEVRRLIGNKMEFTERVNQLQSSMSRNHTLESQLGEVINRVREVSLLQSHKREAAHSSLVNLGMLWPTHKDHPNFASYSMVEPLLRRASNRTLNNSNADWVCFLPSGSEEQILSAIDEASGKLVDVIHLRFAYKNLQNAKPKSLQAADLLGPRAISSLVIRRELLLSLIQDPSGLVSIPLVLQLIARDYRSGERVFNHAESSSAYPFIVGSPNGTEDLLNPWDKFVIDRSLQLNDRRLNRILSKSDLKTSKSENFSSFDGMAVLVALAKIPLKDLIGYGISYLRRSLSPYTRLSRDKK
jgi:hypothetical protein